MSHNLVCYRCGASLSALSLPLSRRVQCPDRTADLHVCKMCISFDVAVPRKCRQDGDEDVTAKDLPNFCDWFKPSDKAFNPNRKTEEDAAKDSLAALFGDDN